MTKKKTKKQTPKLENVRKLVAVSIMVPLISSLCIYWFLSQTVASNSDPKNELQTVREETTSKTARLK